GIGSGGLVDESVVVTNCHVYDCGNYGIFVETQRYSNRSKHAKIVNNTVSGNCIGISNKGTGATLIEGNSSFGNREDGIEIIQNNTDNQIINNKIYDNNKDGIKIDETTNENVTILGNEIKGNLGKGIGI